ncbi:MAG: TDP-N-acetylfucosamine:lipid II N-acetylfucosaminyltransferase [Candidatus Lokiarchaeia archaeon]
MKYLHLMMDNFYSKKFIELIQIYFNTEEHQFIILRHGNEKKYINPDKYQNIKLGILSRNKIIRFLTYKYLTIRKLMKQAEYFFIHYLTEEIFGLLFRFNGKAKIIWVIWGADLYKYIPIQLYDQFTLELVNKLDGKIKSTLNKFYFFFKYEIRKSVIKKIDYVISPHKGDVRLLKKFFKTKAEWYSQTIYPNPVDFEKFDKEVDSIDEKFNFKKKDVKLLLLGNSGFPTNNHLDIMIRLSKMKKQDFEIICPLSYGFPTYIKKIIEKGKRFFGDRFIPLLDFLNSDIYFNILKQIDLAIMYHNRQQGMGNVQILVYLGKPICMKKTSGFFYLVERSVSVFSTQDLERLILNEIKFTEVMSKNNEIASHNLYGKSAITSINSLFKFLEDRSAG